MTDVEKDALASNKVEAEEPVKVKKSGLFYQCMGFVGFQSIEELCLYADSRSYWIASNVNGAISPEDFEARIDAGESLQAILGINAQVINQIEFITPAESQRRIQGKIGELSSISQDLKRRTRIYYGEDDAKASNKANANGTGDVPGGKGHKPVIDALASNRKVPEVSRETQPEDALASNKVEFEDAKPLNS